MHQVTPEIFNTDQGAQYTSQAFTEFILSKGIKLSMDGEGRATDNAFIERLWRSIKYERLYLHEYETGKEVYDMVDNYLTYYNNRPSALLNWERLSSGSVPGRQN
ncbi:integrase core domain-containing protein [Lewinella sp. IMCC34191]|uniref:integrase core domain-containing protein n=1 Tax=Lewinella sp. IMCC34191 TaxID=2259172 RepID=UPI000E25D8BA|nr:integrase core domain-containing protein [Lewinella sp. IMCC34191]